MILKVEPTCILVHIHCILHILYDLYTFYMHISVQL